VIGWRKWGLSFFVILCSFISTWTGTMSDSVAAQLVGVALAAYIGGNVGSKIAGNGKGGDG